MKFVNTKKELCVGCKDCEKACSKVLFKEDDGIKSSIKVTETDGKYDINVCNQCGECMKVCPVQALYRAKNSTVLLDKDKCIHCYACVGFCPTSSMRYAEGVLGPIKCIACGACTRACKTGAIFMDEA